MDLSTATITLITGEKSTTFSPPHKIILAGGGSAVDQEPMQIPDKWREYQCQDYFASALPLSGSWHADGQVWTIELLEGVEEDVEAEFLQVGRPGVDDIGFGYRKNQQGFWAMYRGAGTGEFQYLGATVQEFLSQWYAGTINI